MLHTFDASELTPFYAAVDESNLPNANLLARWPDLDHQAAQAVDGHAQ